MQAAARADGGNHLEGTDAEEQGSPEQTKHRTEDAVNAPMLGSGSTAPNASAAAPVAGQLHLAGQRAVFGESSCVLGTGSWAASRSEEGGCRGADAAAAAAADAAGGGEADTAQGDTDAVDSGCELHEPAALGSIPETAQAQRPAWSRRNGDRVTAQAARSRETEGRQRSQGD